MFGAVILAGGYSSRMEDFKPLMPLGEKTVLGRCANVFRSAGVENILVVTGYRAQDVEDEALKLGLSVVYNPNYDKGMFSSVQAAAPSMADMDGFFVLPVDIPLIRPATVRTIAAAFDGQSVVYPVFAGRRGHPPLMPTHLIEAIRGFHGRGGLRALLEDKPCRDEQVWDGGIHLDADTPADFEVLRRRLLRFEVGEAEEALTLAYLIMPERGVMHGRAVAEVAVGIGQEMNRRGFDLDIVLLHNAALLHDVAKGKQRHEECGAALLTSLGLGALADIVASHRDVIPPAPADIAEKEIVCLADKLVKGAQRVSIEQRFNEKLSIYASDAEACRVIRDRLKNARALQRSVEEAIGCDIEILLRQSEDAGFLPSRK